jgi:hypothetical protein
MDVPALLSIYNRLTLMASNVAASNNEEYFGGVDGDLERQPPSREHHDSENSKEPRGLLVNPKINCYMASFNTQTQTCKMSFIEYTETNHLVFKIEKHILETGRDTRYEFVCDKHNLAEFMTSLFTAVRTATIGTEMNEIRRYGDFTMLQMKIYHLIFFMGNPTMACRLTDSMLEVPLRPNGVMPNVGDIILDRCVGFRDDADIMRGRALAYRNGEISIPPIESFAYGPDEVPSP